MAEETQTTEKQVRDPEREALIHEMLRDALKTELPSELTKNPIIHRGDETLPTPMIVNKIDSAGFVYIWDTRTYQKAPVLYYMLQQKLRDRRKDGSYRWTAIDPRKEPRRGTFRCMLYKDNPEREHYNALGFPVCPKDNLANPYEVRRHMQLKHKSVWAAIDEERKQKERDEDRALQRMLLSSQLGKSAVEQTMVEPKKVEEPTIVIKATEEAPQEKQILEQTKAPFLCGICGVDFGSLRMCKQHEKTHKDQVSREWAELDKKLSNP